MEAARRRHRAAVAAMTMVLVGAAAPGAARAATLTVDNDRAECPSAGFVTVQSAVDAAQGGDTVVVCPGTYVEGPGGPGTIPAGPGGVPPATQPGTNGVSITKSIILRGAGAGLVTIRPNPANGASLIGASENVRDTAGSVLSVHRVGDRVIAEISGLTIEGNGVLVDSGIKFFNAEGSVRNVRVRDLVRPTAPLGLGQNTVGYGMVVGTNLAADTFQVTTANSSFSGYNEGGLLVDSVDPAASGGPAPEGAKLITPVSGNVFTGAGPQGAVTQEGIRIAGNARGTVSNNLVTGHDYTPDPQQGAAVRLAGADMSLVSGTTAVPPATLLQATSNLIENNGYGLLNSELNSTTPRNVSVSATNNWWNSAGGPSIGTPRQADRGDPVSGNQPGPATNTTTSVNYSGFRTERQTAPVAPGTTADAAPTGTIDAPKAGDTVRPGVAITPRASAFDDFGVKGVEFFAPDGTSLGVDPTAPYVAPLSYTPGAAENGADVTIRAVITDSAGKTTPLTVAVLVRSAPAPTAAGTTEGSTPGGGSSPASGGPAGTPPTTAPGGIKPPTARSRPRSLSLKVRSAARRRLTLSGKLSVSGVSCRGGKVRLSFYLKNKLVQRGTVTLRASCTYSVRLVAASRIRGRRLRVTARFTGTKTIAPKSARGRVVRVSKR